MPLRVLLTGKLHGPDMGDSISLIYKASQSGAVSLKSGFVSLDERFRILKEVDWDALNKETEAQPESVATATH
jgi:glutamyl-tRNA synthetase